MELPVFLEFVFQEAGWRFDSATGVVELDLPRGRTQRIHLRAFEQEGEPMVRALSRIGEASHLTQARAEAALRINASLAHGALAIADGILVMVDTILVREADAGEVTAALAFLAEQADRFEEQIFGLDRQ
jgi:hypothetical protein